MDIAGTWGRSRALEEVLEDEVAGICQGPRGRGRDGRWSEERLKVVW